MKNKQAKTLIIDDEPDAREVLRAVIGRFCPIWKSAGKNPSLLG